MDARAGAPGARIRAVMFWLAAALLTLGAGLAVLLPLTGGSVEAAGDENDVAVYRDQLAELERDRARGTIAPDAAEEARAEIGRRILRADAAGAAPASPMGAGARRAVAIVAVLVVPAVSWSLYAALGSPGAPSQPLSARLAKDPADSTVEELVAQAEARLAAKPEDGRGWAVIAPIYLRLGRNDDAVTAYRNAIRLAGETADRQMGLGEALAGAEGGRFGVDAQDALKRALQLQPDNPLARFQLAAAQAQQGRTADALAAWNAMLADLPADSPWRGAVTQAIAQVSAKQPAGAAPGAPAPTKDEVAAAEGMSESSRAGMIEGMVAGLDRKLRGNPNDPDGWMRLVRSYLVLNKPELARDALARGQAALGGGSEDGRKLTAFAASLGLSSEAAQP